MPLYTNTTRGTVRYGSPTWETKFLENDLAVGSVALAQTTGLVDALSIPLGEYERVVGEVNLFYSSSDANEMKVSFNNVDSDNAYIATIIRFSVLGIYKAVSDTSDADESNDAIGSAVVGASDGHGTEIKLNSGSDSDPQFTTIRFTAIGNAAKSGTFNFQASGVAGNPSLLAGSYITYKKF